jgi:hypothetical protein
LLAKACGLAFAMVRDGHIIETTPSLDQE